MPALIERPKMTKGMYQALKRHIMHEREKKKQEQEQDAQMERMKKEREMRKRKEEEDSLTLEQTKEQIQQLETKLESLKQEKHELFSQLKKILHQEDDARRRAQIKEQSELMSQQQTYSHPLAVSAHPMLLQPTVTGRLTLYKPQQSLMPVATGIKRARSPSPPPPAQLYQNPYDAKYDAKYPGQSFPAAKAQQTPAIHHTVPNRHTEFKQSAYPQNQQAGHVTFVSQAGTSTFPQQQQSALYTSSQSPAGKFQPPGSQSAFSSYPSHYAQHQKQITEYAAQGYTLQRVQQPGYLASAHGSSIAIQHQLDHPGQKPAYPGIEADKYKIQQQHVRGMAPAALPGQPATVITQQIQIQQQQTPKSGVVAAYPQPRGQGPPAPAVSAYQPNSSQASYVSQAQQQAPTAGRPPHFSGQQARYY